MGKEGDLWDDSALINAFDAAISKYKKMHGKGFKEDPSNASADVIHTNFVIPISNYSTQEDDSARVTRDGGNDCGSLAIPEVGETESLATAKGFELADSEGTAEHALGSSGFPLKDQPLNNPTSTDIDDYNELYKQYYEVEEQRQNILQKLQNFSNLNYSYPSEAPAPGLQWSSSYATQEYQSSTTQVPCGTMVVSCCSCACQCSSASCSAIPCPLAGVSASNICINPSATKDLGKQPADEDVDIVKTALGAAERAISTLKNNSDSEQENKMKNGAEQGTASGTDLSAVLNAWYTAGLYTGKYLTEQSLSKKQHD